MENTEQKIKVSFNIYEGKKGSILLKFPQKINKLTGMIGNDSLWNGYDLWSEYNIVSKNKGVVFGMTIKCSDLMNPETKDYIAVTEQGKILDAFTKDYRNYFDKSVKEWKDEVINNLSNKQN